MGPLDEPGGVSGALHSIHCSRLCACHRELLSKVMLESCTCELKNVEPHVMWAMKPEVSWKRLKFKRLKFQMFYCNFCKCILELKCVFYKCVSNLFAAKITVLYTSQDN